MAKTANRIGTRSAPAAALALAAGLALVGCENFPDRAEMWGVWERPSRAHPGGYGGLPTRVSESVASSAMDQRPDDPAKSNRSFPGVASSAKPASPAVAARKESGSPGAAERAELSSAPSTGKARATASNQPEPMATASARTSRSRPGSAAPVVDASVGEVAHASEPDGSAARTSRAFPGMGAESARASDYAETTTSGEPVLEPAIAPEAFSIVEPEPATMEITETTDVVEIADIRETSTPETPVRTSRAFPGASWGGGVSQAATTPNRGDSSPPAPAAARKAGGTVSDVVEVTPGGAFEPLEFTPATMAVTPAPGSEPERHAAPVSEPVRRAGTSRAFPGRRAPMGPPVAGQGGAQDDGSSRAFPGRASGASDEGSVPGAMAATPEAKDEATPTKARVQLWRYRPSRAYPGGHVAPKPEPKASTVAGAESDEAEGE